MFGVVLQLLYIGLLIFQLDLDLLCSLPLLYLHLPLLSCQPVEHFLQTLLLSLSLQSTNLSLVRRNSKKTWRMLLLVGQTLKDLIFNKLEDNRLWLRAFHWQTLRELSGKLWLQREPGLKVLHQASLLPHPLLRQQASEREWVKKILLKFIKWTWINRGFPDTL